MALIFSDQLSRHALQPFGVGCVQILTAGSLPNPLWVGFKIDVKGGADPIDVSCHFVSFQHSSPIVSKLLGHFVGSSNRLSRRYLLENHYSCRSGQGRSVERSEMDDSLEAVMPWLIGVVKELHDIGSSRYRASRQPASQD